METEPTGSKRNRSEFEPIFPQDETPKAKKARLSRNEPDVPEERISKLLPLFQFWLSGCNLSKDKYLLSALTEDEAGWTPLSVFSCFNSLETLKATETEIEATLRRLTTPKLEFENRGILRFRMPSLKECVAKALQDVEGRTIFLSRKKVEVSREQLSTAMKRFGNVVYVNIPKERSTAFVEFESISAARRVVAISQRTHLRGGVLEGVRAISKNEWVTRRERMKQRRRKARRSDRDNAQAAEDPKFNLPNDSKPREEGDQHEDDHEIDMAIVSNENTKASVANGSQNKSECPAQTKQNPDATNDLQSSTNPKHQMDSDDRSKAVSRKRKRQKLPQGLLGRAQVAFCGKMPTADSLRDKLEEFGPVTHVVRDGNGCWLVMFMHESGLNRALSAKTITADEAVVTVEKVAGEEEVSCLANIARPKGEGKGGARNRRISKKERREADRLKRRVEPRMQAPRAAKTQAEKLILSGAMAEPNASAKPQDTIGLKKTQVS